MKKSLLLIIYFLECILSIDAQTLYGLTPYGGNDGVGSLIKFIPTTNNLTVAKSFENYAKYPQYTNFIEASDGKLYGMTLYGGNDKLGGPGYGGGVILSFDPSTSTYTNLKNFNGTDGIHPNGSLVLASDGKLYGMAGGGSNFGIGSTYGVIFSFDPSTSAYTKLKDFDGTNGASPSGSLIQLSDGKLYGVTAGGGSSNHGVIFSFDPSNSNYSKLKDFDGDNGANPLGSLVQASDGKLYGMTNTGGNYDVGGRSYGVIFSFDPSTSTYTKLKDFDYTNGANPYGSLMQASDGKLYGMTTQGGSSGVGVIFSFEPSSSSYIKLKDFDGTIGGTPFGSLTQASDGKLYSMTAYGGSSDAGVIFSFDASSSTYTRLKDFNGTDGYNPNGSLKQASNGKIYGMTSGGGSGLQGVIFSFDPSSSAFAKLWDFQAFNGRNPSASPMQASNGKLYGMTPTGGSSDVGVIYSFDPSAGTYAKLKDFNYTDGAYPFGSLVQASNGKLYGMTADGAAGSNSAGVIFSFDPSSSIYTKLMDFDGTNGDCTNGCRPHGSLVQASNGKLYGMTTTGGNVAGSNGVIFSFDPSTSTYTRLKDFDNFINGAQPYGSLVQASNGKLYGMTHDGGINAAGVIFSFDPSTSIYTKLKDFDGNSNYGPYGSLVQASNGKLYGMTYSGGSPGVGTIFSLDPSSSAFTKHFDFDFTNGAYPDGNLIQASDGKLYGMTHRGGSNDAGVIFSFDPSTSDFTKLKDFDFAIGNVFYLGSGFIEVSSSGGNGTIPALSIAITSGTYPSCPGQSITFTATPTNGGSSPLYQWKVDGNNAGTNSSTYTTTTLTNGQVVSCLMTSSAPNANPTTATSNTITMAVNEVVIPTIVITQITCTIDSVTFSSTITNGGTAPAYLWTYTGTGTTTINTGPHFTLHAPSNGDQVQCSLISIVPCANPVQVNSSPLTINCMTTGVSNIDDLEEFKIMPNPNNGVFTIKIKLDTPREVRFTLFNSLGQPVYQSPLSRMNGTQTKQISVSSLPGAVYFLKTEIGNQAIYKNIIIIKN